MDKKVLLSQAIDASDAVTVIACALQKARVLANDQINEFYDLSGDLREDITVEDGASIIYYFPAARQRGFMLMDYIHEMLGPVTKAKHKLNAICNALNEEGTTNVN